jgi:hypothetical protein
VDGDGLADILLGSYNSQGGRMACAVYGVLGPGLGVEDLGDADWVVYGDDGQQAFGIGLCAEDIDGDGIAELLVGARGDSRYAGAVYGWWGPVSGGMMLENADLLFRGLGASLNFGASVAVADLDGDGVGEVMVGAPGDSTGGVSGGAVFAFYGNR